MIYRETDIEKIQELFMGRKVIDVEIFGEWRKVKGHWGEAQGRLTLDDGRIVYIIPNQGGCSCGAGDYDLTTLTRVDNIITRVDVVEEEMNYQTSFKIFVLAGHEQINALQIDGDDGNGWYGTGYELLVVDAE